MQARTYTPPPAYRFDGYFFRPAEPQDLATAQAWNRVDPEHEWEAKCPTYWVEQTDRTNSYVLEDDQGIVFFVKSIRRPGAEIEITLQFDRTYEVVSPRRVINGMRIGFRWLVKALPVNGFNAVYFRSKNEQLGAFAVKCLGFLKDGEYYVYSLHSKEMHHGR
jgi:hypothetical protein